MSWKLTTSLSALVPVLLSAGPLASKAEAHASPHGLQLLWQSTDPNALPVILSNRGLVMPNVNEQDGPDSAYSLRCNESYGVNTSAIPILTLDAQRNLAMATTNGLAFSSDRGCNWTDGTGYPTGDTAVGGAFFQNQAMPNKMVASSLVYQPTAQLYASDDYGHTWTVTGMNNQYSTYSQFLATPDGQTVWASGNYYDMQKRELVPLWAISSDGGKTWKDTILSDTAARFPLGLHPTKSNVVFAHEPSADATNPMDTLTRSDDGGETFTSVTSMQPITSFVTTPDGSHIWVGSSTQGLWVSTDGGLNFTQVDPKEVQGVTCLAYHGDELWVCANFAPNTNGIWKSTDLGASFQPVLDFMNINTEVTCDAQAEPVCHQLWLDWQFEQMYNFTVDAGTPVDADAGAPEGDDAGNQATGNGDSSDDAGAQSLDGGVETKPTTHTNSGGCSTSSTSTRGEETLLSVLVAALAVLITRRSKTPS